MAGEKRTIISNILLWTPKYGHASVGQPVKIYIHQLYADTEWHLEDLPSTMTNKDGRWESRVNPCSRHTFDDDDDESYKKKVEMQTTILVWIIRSLLREMWSLSRSKTEVIWWTQFWNSWSREQEEVRIQPRVFTVKFYF